MATTSFALVHHSLKLQPSQSPIRVSFGFAPSLLLICNNTNTCKPLRYHPISVSSSSSVTRVEEKNTASNSLLPFMFDETDLESNESVWKLYTRWRKHFKVSYDNPNSLNNRFLIFKESVHSAYMDQHILHGPHNSTYTLDKFADSL